MQQQLEAGVADFGLSLSAQQIQQMLDYLELLVKWNKTHNLTAIIQPEKMVDLHLLDSLSVLNYIKNGKVLDVGSGAGLPSIILAIMLPKVDFVSVDTRDKKIQFQTLAASQLGLQNFIAVKSRVQQYQTDEKFDQIICRAFSSLQNFTDWTEHLLKTDGEWLAMKGKVPEHEMTNIDHLSSEVFELQALNNIGERHLIRIKK